MAKAPKHTMSRALVRRETISGYLFLLPSLIFFLGFVVIPMVYCIILSLTDANMYTEGLGNFVGLKNFVELWQDATFLEALKNTFIIVVVSVPTVCAFSLWVSSAIYKLKGPLLCLPLHLLPACGHRFRGRHRRVEVDVRQLHRHLQLRAEGHRYH